MNWCTKSLIVLVVFNGFEYSTAKLDQGCVGDALQKVEKAKKCASEKIGTFSGPFSKDKLCCSSYYTSCATIKTVRKHCSPNSEWIEKQREVSEFKKCATKDLCAKFDNKVGEECNEYTYSECESYSWDPKSSSDAKPEPKKDSKNSFVPISANGLLLFVSVLVSILIIF